MDRYELYLASPPGPDYAHDRAKEIVHKLSEQRQVDALGESWWRTDYDGSEDIGAAVTRLAADLTAVDPKWDQVLVAGYMKQPENPSAP